MLSVRSDRLPPNRLDRNPRIVLPLSLPAGSALSAPRESGGAWRVRSTIDCMNPESSERFAIVDAMAGMAAPSPFDTAVSDSPVCRDKAETIAGPASSRKLSRMFAISPPLLSSRQVHGPRQTPTPCPRVPRQHRLREGSQQAVAGRPYVGKSSTGEKVTLVQGVIVSVCAASFSTAPRVYGSGKYWALPRYSRLLP